MLATTRVGETMHDATKGLYNHSWGERRSAAVSDGDGGLVIAGLVQTGLYATDGLLVARGRGGEVRWQGRFHEEVKTFTGGGWSSKHNHIYDFRAVTRRARGGYAVVGARYGSNKTDKKSTERNHAVIATFNELGRRQAHRSPVHFKKPSSENHGNLETLVEVAKDRLVASGWVRDKAVAGSKNQLWLCGVKDTGVQLREWYSVVHDIASYPRAATLTAGGEFAQAGNKGFVGRFEAGTGKLIAVADPKALKSPATTGWYGLIARGDGLLAAGHLTGDSARVKKGPGAGILAAYGSKGELLWARVHDGPGNAFFTHAAPLSDGRLVAVGQAYVSGFSDQVRVVIFDRWHNVLSEQSFGSAISDRPAGLAVQPDGRIFVATVRGATSDANGVLLITSPWGQDQCVKAGSCADLSLQGCDDHNPCTLSSCDPAGGCSNKAVADGLSCGPGKTCKAGNCGS